LIEDKILSVETKILLARRIFWTEKALQGILTYDFIFDNFL